MTEELAESHSLEVINAAAVLAEAREKSQAAQTDESVYNGLERFFEARIAKGRFIDTGRIPFICDDLRAIHKEVEKINKMIGKFIVAMLILLATILMGLGGWAFTILVHAASK